MSVRQQAELDAMMRQLPLDFGGELTEQRPLPEQLMTAHPLPAGVTVTPSARGGVPAVDITVPGTHGDGVILYFHGGAYAMGSARAAAGLAAGLARGAGALPIAVDCRLAPEHPYPAAPDDAQAAYRALLVDRGPQDIVLAGESAGAGLAAADVSVTLDITAGVPHVFQGFASNLDEGTEALARGSAFIRSHLGIRSSVGA